MVINDTKYDQDMIESKILTLGLIRDNPENVETIKTNPNNIPKSEIDHNKNENVL